MADETKLMVWIDQDLCTGDGICEEIAPDVVTGRDEAAIYDALAQETAAETVRRWSVGFGPKTLIGRTN